MVSLNPLILAGALQSWRWCAIWRCGYRATPVSTPNTVIPLPHPNHTHMHSPPWACFSDVDYGARDVLSDPELREGIKRYTAWPTIPQVINRMGTRSVKAQKREGRGHGQMLQVGCTLDLCGAPIFDLG
jgi:hypothetical protein